ncbi:MAG: SpoIIE family protein phosphatase [Bacteroidales bacterium]|nr:SpoIIE family protein phosphatase [Bacteroidales bacterium]
MANIWKKISYLGVSNDQPLYWQKSIILYNQIARILILIIFFTSMIMFFKMNMRIVPTAFLLTLPVMALSLWLNSLGKVNFSILIISIFFPLFFLFTSVYSKMYSEGVSLIFYIAPRFGIIISIIFPVVILGFHDIKRAFLSSLGGILVFILFDYVHSIFGINVQNIPYYPKNYLFVIFGLAIVLIFFTFLIFSLQRINNIYENIVLNQKKDIEKQRDYAEKQHKEIRKQKEQITDSIRYARRIQTAMLPSPQYIENILPEHFIFFKPKDIVSGDFYFFAQKKNLLYIVAADCTGHGVPGAFMSMLGISFLNAIINSESKFALQLPFVDDVVDKINDLRIKEPTAAGVLNSLREMIKKALKQTGNDTEPKDGMDMALCILDRKKLKMQYAGAHNPLYLFRNKQLIEYKADRMPIGIHIKEKPFTNHEIKLKKEDVFYLFSDGFVDQFNGETGEKYKIRRFKQLLSDIHRLNMSVQKRRLEEELYQWKKNSEQVDDILIVGVRI